MVKNRKSGDKLAITGMVILVLTEPDSHLKEVTKWAS